MDIELNKYLSGYYDGDGVEIEIDDDGIQIDIVLFMRLISTELGDYLERISTSASGSILNGESVCQFEITDENNLMLPFLKDLSKYTIVNGQEAYNSYHWLKKKTTPNFWASNYTVPDFWSSRSNNTIKKPGIAYFAGLFDAMGQVYDDSIVIAFSSDLGYIEYLNDVLINDFGIRPEIVVIDDRFELEIKYSDSVNMGKFMSNIYPFTFYGKLG